jgi:hypothetical protein
MRQLTRKKATIHWLVWDFIVLLGFWTGLFFLKENILIKNISFNVKIIKRLLKELIAEETFIKPQDFFDTISIVGDNTAGRHQAWLFVRRYFDRIVSE